jgi:hypothetical protein
MFDLSQFKHVEATGTWVISEAAELGVELQVPDSDGGPDPEAARLIESFIANRSVLERSCYEYLEHHLKFEGIPTLSAIEAFARPNCHGASMILVYFTEADRYMWLEVGLVPHPSHGFWPTYALVKYD